MEEYDRMETYCRRLGHAVPFGYCRKENCTAMTEKKLPCSKIMDCWFEMMPIHRFIEAHFTPRERELAFGRPGSRLNSICDIVERMTEKAPE